MFLKKSCDTKIPGNDQENVKINMILDHFKTQDMCNKAIDKDLWSLAEVPEHFKTQEMCNKAVEKDPYSLAEVPDHFKT